MTFKSKIASVVSAAKAANNSQEQNQQRCQSRAVLIAAGLKPMPEVNKTGVAVLIGAFVISSVVSFGILSGAGAIVNGWLPADKS